MTTPSPATYDKLAIGSLFSFSPPSPTTLIFEKVSEGYSRCLADGIIGPDYLPGTPPSQVIVYYHGTNALRPQDRLPRP